MYDNLFQQLADTNRITNLEMRVNQLERQVKFLNDLIKMQIKINSANVETLKTISNEGTDNRG